VSRFLFTAREARRARVTGLEAIPVTAVRAGAHYGCALGQNTVRCWGLNAYGQLGTGDTDWRAEPTAVVGQGFALTVTAALGGAHGCSLGTAGELTCWGRNHLGQLGLGADGPDLTRKPVIPVGF